MIFLLSLTVLMLLVIYFDATRYLIPNWLNGLVLILYPAAVLTSPVPVDWLMALAGAAIVFFVGYVLFSFKLIGGGDVKLLAPLALWVGWNQLLVFILWVAIIGGVISLLLLSLRKFLLYATPYLKCDLPRILKHGSPVAYGLAIAGVFLHMLWTGQVPLAVMQ